MKQWVAGQKESAAKIDPTVGAIVVAIVDLVVMMGLHTKLGVSESDLLQIGLHVGTLLLVFRSAQINVLGRNKATEPAADPAPTEDEPASDPSPAEDEGA